MASKKVNPKKAVAKKVVKKTSKRASVVKKSPLKTIMVVSATDRNEARRALLSHFKINSVGIEERNAMRRAQRDSFKNY